METFTSGQTPTDTIFNALPFKYEMKLNKSDMLKLLTALQHTAETSESESLEEWAYGFRSDILTTIGIEEV